MKKRILVTGASGFVMHHVVEHILKNTDWEIVCIDRMDSPRKNGYDRLRDIAAFDDSRVKCYTHNLNLPFSVGLKQEIGDIHYFLNGASGSHVDNSIVSPVEFVQNNVNIALYCLEYARELNDKGCLDRYIQFSTDEVYGTAPFGVNYKEGDRHNPGNPYASSKSAQESIVRAYANTYKLPCIITNTMNVLGERQDPEKFLPKIINYVLEGKTLSIHSDSSKTKAGLRHYIHARNIGSALIHILKNSNELLHNVDAELGTFNIVGEKEYDNLELAKLVASYVGKPLKYEMVDFHSSRPGHDLRYSLNGSKMRDLGWTHPVSIEDSIKKIVEWTLLPENIRWLKE